MKIKHVIKILHKLYTSTHLTELITESEAKEKNHLMNFPSPKLEIKLQTT